MLCSFTSHSSLSSCPSQLKTSWRSLRLLRFFVLSSLLTTNYASATTLQGTADLIQLLVHSTPFEANSLAKPKKSIAQDERLFSAYRALQESNPKLTPEARRKAVETLLTQAREHAKSPLLPYVYYLIYQTAEPFSAPYRAAEQFFATASDRKASCPYFYYMNDKITRAENFFAQPENLNAYIGDLREINNRAMQNRLLRNLLATMTQAGHTSVGDKLAWAGKSFPALRQDYPWIGGAPVIPPPDQPVPSELETMVQQASKQGGCEAGRKKLAASIGSKHEGKTLEQFVAAAEKLDACVRPQGAKARIQIWRSLAGPAIKAYGIAGWATVHLKMARLLWNDDQHTLAKKLLAKIVTTTRKKNYDDGAARATYMHAAILQNENNKPGAIKHYENFLKRYSSHALANDARQTLLILYAGEKLWPHVYNLAGESITGLNAGKFYFDKSTASSYYFWQARAAQILGKTPEAQRNWEILADKYFGTYYGALGHYLLETSLNKEVPLQPHRQIPFDRDLLVEAFNPLSPGRQKISLIFRLLELGLYDDAGCETSLMTFEANSPGQQLTKALLLHVTGEWLEAVKVYGKLPDDYRQTLPLGLEKIFYPKKFETEILEYSQRVDIDPDFVFSLIRQESVFNPMALSPVGAKGLMQIMNDTARRESQKLSPTYLHEKQREEIVHRSKFPAALFDVETNVILGIHHLKTLQQQFNSPILILSAYNAGPGATNKWVDRLWSDDALVFIENIPYQETRNYIKYIMRNYFYYKRLYPSGNEKFSVLTTLLEGSKLDYLPLATPPKS